MKKKAAPAKKAAPGKPPRRATGPPSVPDPAPLFDRVASILEAARAETVRAVNSRMVLAYWLIGREIVQELQEGDERAAYGRKILAELSLRLSSHYGEGYSLPNLRLFRQFFLAYAACSSSNGHAGRDDLNAAGILFATLEAPSPAPAQESGGPPIRYTPRSELPPPFHPAVSWSQYRLLMRVEKPAARDFYESECAAAGWTTRELERQIHSFYYERLLASTDKKGMVHQERGRQPVQDPAEVLTSTAVLEFLGIPRSPRLSESTLEQAIMDNLQTFLLELGRGFSFVARQKRLLFEADEFFVDLVFYNYLLHCFVLIDLKIGPLTHQDVGQMDSYVRLYEDRYKVAGDNPTIGLILCSEKNETIARYSVLHENQQLFASKYRLHLPSEEELAAELKREIKMIGEGRE